MLQKVKIYGDAESPANSLGVRGDGRMTICFEQNLANWERSSPSFVWMPKEHFLVEYWKERLGTLLGEISYEDGDTP